MKHSFVLSLLFFVFAAVPLSAQTAPQQLERLKYNNPGLVVDLGVGLWAWPIPMDVNGDGFTDLVVVCEDKPYNGTYVFEHPGTKDKMPVFKKARRISKGIINVQISYVDGKPRVLSPAKEYPDFVNSGVDNPVDLPLPPNPHPNKLRGNMWKYVDYDGDGKTDILIGVDDWTDYGWDNTFDEEGNWTRGPLRGLLYVAKNIGTNEQPKYDTPFLLNDVDGNNLETFGWPCPNMVDWDGDGDLDIICGEFRDCFTYFQNIGTRTEPKWAKGVQIKHEDGRPLVMDLQMVTPVAFDWTGNGFYDLICGDEDGRIALIENTGKFKDGVPVFLEPKYFQQEADEVKCGALATPCCVDWNGDGAWDIISGNTAGYIVFYENLSGPGVEHPKWAAPKYLEVDGKPIRDIFLAGKKGSIQGPCEAKWGYTTLTVADWDGDGLLDIMANSIWGKVVWFKNVGTKTAPKLAAPQPVEVEWEGEQPRLSYGWLKPEGKALLTQWRTTPVMFDWNRDGLMDLLMLDHEGYFCFYERKKQADGSLILLPPKRVFVDEKGNPIRLNSRIAGGSGRRKISVVDYDGDGKTDFLVNSVNAELWRQVGTKDGTWIFKNLGNVDSRPISGHSTSPTWVDFNGDKIPDPLIGAEDGYFYYKRNTGLEHMLTAQRIQEQKEAAKKRFETGNASIAVKAVHTELDTMKKDGKAFANRNYVWLEVPAEWSGFEFLRTHGGEAASVTVTAKEDTVIHVVAMDNDRGFTQTIGWEKVASNVFRYSDGGKTQMSLFKRPMKKGETLELPQTNWTGGLLLFKTK
ncbi:MAG: VCBS repeat-containing protein [Planctomycetaceae bacterium]|nr:VCBS repeat-containing protein [Planctomycetaceae bacterium]